MMRRNSILALGILLAVACEPVDTPLPPAPPAGGENDSTIVDSDSTVVDNDSTIMDNDSTVVMPDVPVDTDSLGLSAMDITFNPTDETAYTELPEEVVTDDTHDDYGDFVENYRPTSTITVTYDGDKATVSGGVSGVLSKVTGAHVVIQSTKKNIAYLLKGSTANGSFKLSSNNKTQITLQGVSITNPSGAAVNIQSGKTMLMVLADGTENYVEDGASYEFTLPNGEQQKGALFSEGQLVFSGDGSLEVKSNCGHGIASDDYVRVRGGHITVNSVRDGINTNDRFVMYGGTVNVAAQQDGIDIGKGYIEIGGGRLDVTAVDEGITASYEGEDDGSVDPLIAPYIAIKGGLVKVATTGDKGHALRAMSTLSMSGGIVQATVKGAGSKALLSESGMALTGGKVTAITEGGALYEEGELSSSAAIRSKGELQITGMVVGVKSTGPGSKGINNVGNIVMDGSSVKVVATGTDYAYNGETARCYGVSTDGTLSVSAGTLLVKTTHTPIKAAAEQVADDVTYAAVTTETAER